MFTGSFLGLSRRYGCLALFLLFCIASCAHLRLSKEELKSAEKFYGYGTEYLYKYKSDSNRRYLEFAKREYKKAIAINPKDARFYQGVGLACMLKEEYVSSLAMFDKAISLIPVYKAELKRAETLDHGVKWKNFAAELYNNKAAALNQLSEWDKAVDACNKGLVYRKSYKTPEVLYYQMGVAYLSKKDFNSALKSFSEMVAINDGLPDAHYYRALSYSKLNKNSDAVEEYEKALKLYEKVMLAEPKVPKQKEFVSDIHRTLGVLYFGMGDKEEAVRHMEKAYSMLDKEQDKADIKKYLDMFR